MTSQLPNVWHVRTVADTGAKSCFICYKPTPKVLITPDNKDFFYVCASHLTDKGFASPIVDAEAEAARLKREAMDREIAKVTEEYEEKQRKKKAKKKSKDKDDSKDPKNDEEDDGKAEREKDEKIKSITSADATQKPDDDPRKFALHKSIYQMRVDRLRNIEIAKRNQQRMKDPGLFPSVPKGELGSLP